MNKINKMYIITLIIILIIIMYMFYLLYILNKKNVNDGFIDNNIQVKKVDFSRLTLLDFKKYITSNTPIIFTNVIKKKITFIDFCNILEDKQINIRSGNYGDTVGRKYRKFYSQLLSEYCKGTGSDYGGNNIITGDELNKLNLGINNNNFNNFREGKLWIGKKGSRTPLHKDEPENLALQLFGKKQWIIYNSNDIKYLCYDKSNKKLEWSKYFIDDFKSCPNAKKATPIKLILNPGDMLYLPKQWSHDVTNITDSIMINFWYKNSLDLPFKLNNNNNNNENFSNNKSNKTYTIVFGLYKITDSRFEGYKSTLYNICLKILEIKKKIIIVIFTDQGDVINLFKDMNNSKIIIINLLITELPAYNLSQNIDPYMQRFSVKAKEKKDIEKYILRKLNEIWCSKLSLMQYSTKYSDSDYYIWLDASNRTFQYLLLLFDNEQKISNTGIGLRTYSHKRRLLGISWKKECCLHRTKYMAGLIVVNKKDIKKYSEMFLLYMKNYLQTCNQFTEELLLSKHETDFGSYDLNIPYSSVDRWIL